MPATTKQESSKALGCWASKDKQATDEPAPVAPPFQSSTRRWKKPKAVAEPVPATTKQESPKALGFWASKNKQATYEPAPAAPPLQSSTRRWKKPKSVAEPVPATTKQESNTTTDIDESAPVAARRRMNHSPSAGLEGNSSHHNNKFAVSWLKPATPKASEREPSPPSPGRPRYKGSLVDRYISVAKKENESEHERRMDQIPQSPEDRLEDGAAIKLQALFRGFMARRKVVKYVDSLIEELTRKMNVKYVDSLIEVLMREMNADQNKEEAERRRKEQVEEERRRQEEEEELSKIQRAEALRKKEEDEERRRQEEEERRLRGYDDRVGLPLWWMELVPHNNLDQKAYKAFVKVTIIDYKKATNGFEKRNAEPLEAVTETDESDDESDANLDKILGNSQPAKKPAGPKPTNKQSKSSMFSCMCMDAIVGVEYTTDPKTRSSISTKMIVALVPMTRKTPNHRNKWSILCSIWNLKSRPLLCHGMHGAQN